MSFCSGCEKMNNDCSYYPSIILRETGSTNDDIENLLTSGILDENQIAGFHGYTEFAFLQTKGHGRFDRRWSSNYGGLYQSTLFFKEMLENIDLNMITTIAAAAVFNTVREFIGHEFYNAVKIKWPNDIVIGEKKVAGILLKSIIGYKPEYTPIIIGAGINMFNEIPSDMVRTGSALMPDNLQSYNDVKFADEMLIRAGNLLLKNLWELLKFAGNGRYGHIFNDYNENLLYRNRRVKLYNLSETDIIIAEGIFAGINQESHIKIKNETDGKISEYAAGEIKLS